MHALPSWCLIPSLAMDGSRAIFALFSFVSLLGVVTAQGQTGVSSTPFPAFFIFGDSLVDAGNNNYIVSVARANQLPFGIDFPKGPTGRFCNGKTVLDVIAELINLPFPPPYLDPTTKGQALLQGVNYASGAGGILRSSGFNFIGRVDFDTQITWFQNNVQQLKQILGESAANDLLAKSLFATVFGSNDYVNNYLLSYSPINKVYTPTQFQSVVLQKTSDQITQLYNLGARLIAVSGVGPLGCIPSQLVRQKSVDGSCSDFVNNLSQDFNTGLKAVIQQLNTQLPGVKVIYADTFNPVIDYVHNPSKYGFKYSALACCGAGKYKGQLLCVPVLKPCPDRKDYVWWDAFHPTEAANELLGRSLFSSLKSNIGL